MTVIKVELKKPSSSPLVWNHKVEKGAVFYVEPEVGLGNEDYWRVIPDNEINNINTPEEWKNKEIFFSVDQCKVLGFNEEVSDGTQSKIVETLEGIRSLLLEKNRRYGDSAVNPSQIFSTLSGEEGIKIRLDDKIGRIRNSGTVRKNDVADIMGYLVLYAISQDWTNFDDLID